MNLNAQDRQLVNTQFSPEIEKLAQEKLATIQQICAMGEEEAIAAADELEKSAQEQHEAAEYEAAEYENYDNSSDQEKVASENFIKTASELGSFYERTFTETLEKLGQERYNDPSVYLIPLMREKVAQEAADYAVAEFDEAVEKVAARSYKDAYLAATAAAKGSGKKGLDSAKAFGRKGLDSTKAFGRKGLDSTKAFGRKGSESVQDIASGASQQFKATRAGIKDDLSMARDVIKGKGQDPSTRRQLAGMLAAKAAIPAGIGAAGAGVGAGAGYMAGRKKD